MEHIKAPVRPRGHWSRAISQFDAGARRRRTHLLAASLGIVCLTITSSAAFAQSGAGAGVAVPGDARSVSGTVSNSLAQALSGVKVMLKDATGRTVSEAQSDTGGRFTFNTVAPGTYSISAESQGFQPGTAIVTVGGGAVPPVSMTLAADAALNLQVAAERLNRARNALSPVTGSSQYSFSAQDIQNLPQGDSTQFHDVLLRAPGVADDNFGQLHIRGDHADVQYRINGVILPEGITGFGSALDTRFASSINLLTGALPAQYGYRTAGVVEIETKNAYQPGGQISLDGGGQGTANPSFGLGGSAGPINYYITGSLLRNNLGLENPTSSSSAIHDRTEQGKGFAYFSMLPNPDTRISLMLGAYQGKFQIPNVPGATPDPDGLGFTTGTGGSTFDSATLNENQSEANRYAILALQGSLGDDIDYQVALFHRYTDVHFTPDEIGDPIFTGAASDIFKSDSATGVQGDASWRLNPRHTLRSGLFASSERVENNNTATVFPVDATGAVTGPLFTINDNNPKGGNRLLGLYLQDEWKATAKLTVNYGLRYDYMNEFVNATQWSPRLGAVYQWTPQTTLHAGYARYFTPPPTELVSSATLTKFAGTSLATDPTIPNDPVQPERDHYFDAGILHRFSGSFNVGADAYYKIAKDLIDEGQFGPAPIFTPFNYEEGKVYGLELTANYQRDNWTAYANIARSYAFGKNIVSSQATSGFSPEELAFVAGNWVHLDHDQAWSASAGATYRQGATHYSADFIFGSGLRADASNPNDTHLPAYLTANFSVTHDFNDTSFGKLQARLAIINVGDKVYEIRDGTGIGVGPPAFGQRRTLYAGITKSF